MASFLGMRGTGDWVTNQRPENWREGILKLYPEGMSPLTAIMSKLRSEVTDDPTIHYWTRTLPTQRATVTGVWTNTNLSSAYASGGTAGQVLYLQMAAADLQHFKEGHVVTLRDGGTSTRNPNPRLDTNGRVTGLLSNGASSYISVRLLEADDNDSANSNHLNDCNVVWVTGSAYAQGADTPTALQYNPTEVTNRTQIFRTALEATGTALNTRLRTGPVLKQMTEDALEMHGIELEKATFFSVNTTGTGENGKPLNTMMGIFEFIRTYSAANMLDWQSATGYSAPLTWIAASGGQKWLNESLEQIARYANLSSLMAFCGSGALLGLNRLAFAGGQIQLQPTSASYGLKVTNWVTPFGTLPLMTHPLLSLEATTRNRIVIVSPRDMIWRPMKNRDTHFRPDPRKEREAGPDRTLSEFLTEATMEYRFAERWGVLDGVGLDLTI